MRINKENLKKLKKIFLDTYPDFVTFSNPGSKYEEEEGDWWKLGAVKSLHEEFDEWINKRFSPFPPKEFIAKIQRLSAKLIIDHRFWIPLINKLRGNKKLNIEFQKILYVLLKSAKEKENIDKELNNFINWLINHKFKSRHIRTYPTIFLMCWMPEKFVCMYSYFNQFCKLVSGEKLIGENWTSKDYKKVLSLFNELKKELKELQPRNMIDLYSFYLLSSKILSDKSTLFENSAENKISQILVYPKIYNALINNPQIILYGPPGSGKTYTAKEYIKWLYDYDEELFKESQLSALLGNSGIKLDDEEGYKKLVNYIKKTYKTAHIWEIIQFHPSYCYEDFVRGLVAEPTENGITFKAKDKILVQMAKLAKEAKEQKLNAKFYLIIDEINRADISKVLGELIYALEYRKEPVSLQYDIEGNRELRLPQNLYIIGTMNTADRSIALVDYAIRRRFAFIKIPADKQKIEEFYTNENLHLGKQEIADRLMGKVIELYKKVEELFENIDDKDDIMVGHSYFMVKGYDEFEKRELDLEKWAKRIAFKFAFEVVPLLEEYIKEGRFPHIKKVDELKSRSWGFDWKDNQFELAEEVKTYLLS